MAAILADNIDRLMTTEVRPGGGNLPRGIMAPLYAAARRQAGEPLTLRFAQRLKDAVRESGDVLIFTGAGCPPHLPLAEVDGLLGAVAMARSLHLEWSATVHILVEERALVPLSATIRAAGLNVGYAEDDPASRQDHAVVVHATPVTRDECATHAARLVDEYKVCAMVAIEKLGPNEAGIIHGATGLSFDEQHTKADEYFNLGRSRGIPTFGIGDNGNEIGFGIVQNEVRDIMPAGRECECGCGQGTACAVATDSFVVAAVSNWGGYAVCGMLAYLAANIRTVVTPDDLSRMLRACVDGGALDGGAARPTLSDDCVPYEANLAYVTMLRHMVEMAMTSVQSPGH